jgi:UDP-3-O-[3-hydroxymyristoyl] glucosamine N-acyltransferase
VSPVKQLSLSEIALRTKSTLSPLDHEKIHQSKTPVLGLAPLSGTGLEFCGFLANEKYLSEAVQSTLGAILLSEKHATAVRSQWESSSECVSSSKHPRPVLMVCANPYAQFARLAQFFQQVNIGYEGHSSQAFVDVSAQVDSSAVVFPFVYVGPGARVGANTILYSGAFVGAGSVVGEGCVLYANVVVREGCRVGNHCILNPGAVVGGDGFGFAPDGMENVKIPQVGGVVLEDHVELGSCTSVDRGALQDTVVGTQSKLDSLVQVGHNVKIGKACFLASQSAVAGSSILGDRVTLAGQVGINGHIQIADRVTVLGQSGVTKSIEEAGAMYSGTPALPNVAYLRLQAAQRRAFLKSKK